MTAKFLQALRRGPLVCDGAMGTQLYERGIYINRNFDLVNLERPDLVRQIHLDYILAGAQIIETNTFGANIIKLRKHGAEEDCDKIVRAGVKLAKEAAQDRCFVAGAVGPTGLIPAILSDAEIGEIRDSFRRQVETLAEGGVDLIILETFQLLSELRLALEAAKITGIPVIAQAAFDSDRLTSDGASPAKATQLLKDCGADVVGANCVEGPRGIHDVVVEMLGRGVPVSAQPNAGYPRKIDERLIYMSSPDYFAVYARRFFKAGVSIVGGCCGTGPRHIHEILAAARMMGGGRTESATPIAVSAPEAPERGLPVVPTAEKTRLSKKVRKIFEERVRPGLRPEITPENFVVSVEVNPPKGLSPARALRGAAMLKEAVIDVINSADGPRASVRMSNTALATLVQNQIGLEVITHVCCRDRNLLGLQSDLLAAHVLGLHNLVIITGDPPKMGDYPHATAVYDLDSIGLLRVANGLNHGLDPAGKGLKEVTRFFLACGAEPAAKDYDRELRRLEEKKKAGAELIMTQPVYDPELLRRFLHDIKFLDLPVLVGLLPLASARNAEFLHNEVPGMSVPEPIRKRIASVPQGPEARRVGIKICQEALMEVVHDVVGAYIMPPFSRYESAIKVMEPLGYSLPPTALAWP